MTISTFTVALINRAHKGDELAWYDPVEVSVLYLFVVFILLDIEGVEIVPAFLHAELKAFYAVLDCAFVETLTFASISKGLQVFLHGSELLQGPSRVDFQDDDHEGTHQEACVSELVTVVASRVVIDPSLALELRSIEELGEFSAVSMNHSKIQWAEVLVERHVC